MADEDTKTVIGADGVTRILPLSDADKAQRVIDQAASQLRRDNEAAENTRLAALAEDAQTLALIDRLANSTDAQINSYFANNVTTAPQAIAVLKALVKVVALKLRLK